MRPRASPLDLARTGIPFHSTGLGRIGGLRLEAAAPRPESGHAVGSRRKPHTFSAGLITAPCLDVNKMFIDN